MQVTPKKVLLVINGHDQESYELLEPTEEKYNVALSNKERTVSTALINDKTTLAPHFSAPEKEEHRATMAALLGEENLGFIGKEINEAEESGKPFDAVLYLTNFTNHASNRESFSDEKLKNWIDSVSKAVGDIPTALLNLTSVPDFLPNVVTNIADARDSFKNGRALLSRISEANSDGDKTRKSIKDLPAFNLYSKEWMSQPLQQIQGLMGHLDTIFNWN